MAQSNEQGTDTNQASEDEQVRKAILKILHQTESCTGCKDHYKKPHKCDMDLAAPRCVKRVRKLEVLIRTEKLKLLAEVRERAEMVVGNVFDPSGEYVSVSEITKLEAEL